MYKINFISLKHLKLHVNNLKETQSANKVIQENFILEIVVFNLQLNQRQEFVNILYLDKWKITIIMGHFQLMLIETKRLILN